MAVNKNFVVKNGLEVASNVILADATTKNVGIGSTQPEFTLDVSGGIGATDVSVTGFTTLTQDLQVGTSGSVFYVSDSNNNVGVGTSVPNPLYTLDVRSPVSTGQTALYVYGDMRVTGDISLDDLTLDDATLSELTVNDTLNVLGVSTFQGNVNLGDNDRLRFGDGADLQIYHDASNSWVRDVGTGRLILTTDGISIDFKTNSASEFMARFLQDDAVELYYDNSKKLETTTDGVVITGIVTATSFVGEGQIGVGSEGSFIGTGVTMVDFKSSNSANTVDVSSGIATVTVQTGVSLGLAIALGG